MCFVDVILKEIMNAHRMFFFFAKTLYIVCSYINSFIHMILSSLPPTVKKFTMILFSAFILFQARIAIVSTHSKYYAITKRSISVAVKTCTTIQD